MKSVAMGFESTNRRIRPGSVAVNPGDRSERRDEGCHVEAMQATAVMRENPHPKDH